jgi:hypothetical protein
MLIQVVHAEVLPLTQIHEMYPELISPVDPADFTRLRFVITLQNTEGEIRRLRLIQWNDRSLSRPNTLPKDTSAKLAEGFAEALMYSVESMTLAAVQKNLGMRT